MAIKVPRRYGQLESCRLFGTFLEIVEELKKHRQELQVLAFYPFIRLAVYLSINSIKKFALRLSGTRIFTMSSKPSVN